MESSYDRWAVSITDSQDDGYRVYLSLFPTTGLSQASKEVHYLHPIERRYFDLLKFDRRIQSYLSGRMAAKQAISKCIREERLESICIDQGIFQHPVVVHPRKGNYQVSITHCHKLAASIAHTDYMPMGIDLESIDERLDSILESQMTDSEVLLANTVNFHYSGFLTVVWTVKEALSKVLRTGFTVPLQLFELKRIEQQNDYFVSRFVNFPQYEAISLVFKYEVCSIVYPKQMRLDIESIKQLLVKAGL
ncbi:4'-phosphopantetheinyl transferase superfamily protein [Brevibacillus halotolerans]|uniref:4'-phosphopantetheinyl transferase family protein n=1 Tax=Brevibacillus laterosporus TaxID=1465 RepID=UPI00215C126F|nr:4'-phosphopantetheinyl transferase superfamily protein [Brevibacillus laterosporus]MCR8995121.1 4'-phosphopantetheinyl transferase superfamily protein [Brevibacillus laterosporus]WPS89517.1 4'-phosphopantetheinyl transferase superfamily protein [Brevibacillus halotolerans]